MKSTVEVYCQFDPLEEVWLGDCYPEEFYADLAPNIRSAFSQITEVTKRDLDILERRLQSLGIIVHRPTFTNDVNDYRDKSGNLLKPPIAPRDDNIALGKIFYNLRHNYPKNPWQHILDQYYANGVTVYEAQFLEKYGYLQPPSIVRLGKDILIDIDTHAHSWELMKKDVFPEWQEQFRIIACHTNGHSDSVFCVPQPGAIITSHWKGDYSKELPQWEIHHLQAKQNLGSQGSLDWWIKDHNELMHCVMHTAFTEHIQTRALNWVGNAQETVFEVNSLVINESLIVTTGKPDTNTKKWFAHKGIDYIPIEFSARTFWDSGVHCLTVDTKRQGGQRDFFPERDQKIYYC